MHILEEIREVAVSKNVNFLIGSGCSADAIETMSTYWEEARKNNGHEKPNESAGGAHCKTCEQDGNELLLKDVIRVSEIILGGLSEEDRVALDSVKLVSRSYTAFIREIVSLMNRMNSRQIPKNVNIFTTNYDLFLESALDKVSKSETFVVNDGSRGYFERILDNLNFNRTVSYRGPSNNFIDEIPSVSLIKPHGSVNWKKTDNDEIEIKAQVVDDPVIVKPDGHESRNTFAENYFHDTLRIFQTELDKPQSVLFVVGFSFQDKHISKMMQRALRNKELKAYIFCYSDRTEGNIIRNLGYEPSEYPKNLKFIWPRDIRSDSNSIVDSEHLTLDDVTRIFSFGVK